MKFRSIIRVLKQFPITLWTLKTRCIVAGCAIVIVPETVGSEQRGPVKDPRQRYSISGDRRADIEPKPTNEREQQSDIIAQVLTFTVDSSLLICCARKSNFH